MSDNHEMFWLSHLMKENFYKRYHKENCFGFTIISLLMKGKLRV